MLLQKTDSNCTLSKKLIIIAFILFSINNFAQQLFRYQVSEDVSIKIPENFKVEDTLQQHVVKAFIGDHIIMIMKPDQQVTTYVEDQEDLIGFYDGLQKGMLRTANAKLIDKEIIEIKGLKFLKITFSTSISGELKIWDNFTLLLNNYPYSFIFVHSDQVDKNFMMKQKEIISSIQFRKGISAKNQLNANEEDSNAYKLGELAGSLFVYAVIIGIILFLILRKRKK